MVPIKTSVEDIQKLLSYLGKQIGWVDQPKIEKALGALDDRKIGAMVEFGLILRDGGNLRTTLRGQLFNTDPKAALREVLSTVELYRATLEWIHYGSRTETTAAEIGQYWESIHKEALGGLSGTTLGSGALTFARVVDGAGLEAYRLPVTDIARQAPAEALHSLRDATKNAPASYRPYLDEAVDCYEACAYRGAVLMVWAATIEHIYSAIESHSSGFKLLEAENFKRYENASFAGRRESPSSALMRIYGLSLLLGYRGSNRQQVNKNQTLKRNSTTSPSAMT